MSLNDATSGAVPRSDVIYVCAGCTHPVRSWAEALTEGGRLLFPITPGWGRGAMLMVTRRGDRLDAELICRCAFIPCLGASDTFEEPAVRNAFENLGSRSIRSLHFGRVPRATGHWLAGDGWWIQ